MHAISILSGGAALLIAAGQSPAEVFQVTTIGEHSVKGKVELSGTAFAVTPDLLLTTTEAVGAAREYKAEQSGLPRRTITISSPGDASAARMSVTVGERLLGGEVVALIPVEGAPMEPEALSACPPREGASYEIRSPSFDGEVVGQIEVFSSGLATRFTARTGWDSKQAAGSPVLDPEGRAVGILTSAAPDASAVGFLPFSDIVHFLPENADIACDPRQALVDLQTDIDGLSRQVREAARVVRRLQDKVAAAEAAGNFAIDVLADVATDLEQINAARSKNEPITPMLESMKTRLQSLKLAPTVRTIDALLRRPDWLAKAKSLGGNLTLTFTYRTQLPGPPFSPVLKLCLRAIKPYEGIGSKHDFRAVEFFSRATADDAEPMVACKATNVNIPSGRQDVGQYAFEVAGSEMTDLFEVYRQDSSFLPEEYKWSGLTYAALVRPGDQLGDGEARRPDEVILHMLILPPDRRDDSPPGAAAVQCKLFEDAQRVIDFLSLDDWQPSQIAFDDVEGVVLDPENESDECVQPSVQ